MELFKLILQRQILRAKILKVVSRVLLKKRGFVLPDKAIMMRVATVIETVLCARYTLALFAFGKKELRVQVLACLKKVIDKARCSLPKDEKSSSMCTQDSS